ncbi:uncharacterized protein LOC126823976 [Patella vulgata]|uniref:uncharacterized protein LOC126823976 n=1 Tax=Patella vulgata TaxID=6465 RepID=UPI00217FC2EA|nr:uncharacterized protein LOC126823976 [Patella vulgata]XP_055957582.1 uncharacterized protein LOC126823976 [Patella vulgata]
MLHIVLVVLVLLHQTNGHARLIDPPSRASMFRFGYNTPPDYNDNQGFCGGKERQQKNNGQCGVCGDPWDAAVKPHEAGGIYATGQIVRTYKTGALITATVQVTANHIGYFEFRICVNNDVTKPATHECFNKHLLELGDRPGSKFYIDKNNGDKKVSLKLPEGVVCSQCVFQWRYRAGNSWGTDPNGKSCVGCGAQEEYYACADISIVSGGLVTGSPVAGVTIPTKYPATSVTVPTKSSVVSATVRTEIPITRQSQPHKTSSFAPVQSSQKPSTNKNCHAIGQFKNDQTYHNWCSASCAQDICPDTICRCDDVSDEDGAPNVPECMSHGVFKSNSMDQWCKTNCQLKNCPASHCTCA